MEASNRGEVPTPSDAPHVFRHLPSAIWYPASSIQHPASSPYVPAPYLSRCLRLRLPWIPNNPMPTKSRTIVLLSICLAALAACGGAEAKNKAAAGTASAVMNAAATGSASSDERVRRADLARIKGDTAAKVWMVIVSDFQCPFCKHVARQTSAKIDQEYVATGKIRWLCELSAARATARRSPSAEPRCARGCRGNSGSSTIALSRPRISGPVANRRRALFDSHRHAAADWSSTTWNGCVTSRT